MREWDETIEELKKESIHESRVRNFLRNFFYGKSSSPTPAPAPAPTPPGSPVVPNPALAAQYVEKLNQILNKHQKALVDYAETIDLRDLKRRIKEFDFRNLPAQSRRDKPADQKSTITVSTAPTPFSSPPGGKTSPTRFPAVPPAAKTPAPVPIPTSSSGAKKKNPRNLPHNSIFFEALSREWNSRISGLNQVLADAYKDILDFLNEIAKASGFTPKNPNNIRSLVSEMKHFTILDKRNLHFLRTKLMGFMITYRQLQGYLEFFTRTQKNQRAAEKKSAKKIIP